MPMIMGYSSTRVLNLGELDSHPVIKRCHEIKI